jgi:hypothetical protein
MNIYIKNITMKKVIRLTESDITRILKKVINEQQENTHPQSTKIYNELEIDLEGDGPYVVEETPHQLIVKGIKHKWTITVERNKGYTKS